MKRWLALAAGVIIQTALGGIYAWSAFVPHLMNTFGFTRTQCANIFGIMIAVFSLSTIPAGKFFLRFGPRLTAGIGTLLFSVGYIVSSFSGGNYFWIVGGIGITTGIGIGFGYICPLSVGMKWFPDRRGLVTGVMVAGFGLGAAVLSWFIVRLAASYHILTVFRLVGIVFGGIASVGAMFLSEPESNRKRENPHLVKKALRSIILTPPFLLLWFSMFAGTFAGLLISGNLKPLMTSLGLSASRTELAIPLFALGNTLGRLVWGHIHDRLGSKHTILLSLTILFLSIFPLLLTFNTGIALVAVGFIGFGFGACFVVYAASVVDVFKVENLPRLYPIIFIAYGVAALIGPPIGGKIADSTGSYTGGLIISNLVLLLVLMTVFLKYPSVNKQEH